MRVVVIIPALDEEKSLPKVLADIPSNLIDEVFVVDNGSTDSTANIARQAGATVLHEPRKGYGQACLTGISALAGNPPDIVVFLDGDYSDRPSEIDLVLQPISNGTVDFVVGTRTNSKREPGALPLHARFGNWLATLMIRLLYGYQYTDLGPFRAIRYKTLLALNMQDRNYGWTAEMQAKAARCRIQSCEIPVSYHPRIGQSKITGTIHGTIFAGWKIITTILLCRLSNCPENIPLATKAPAN